MTDARAPESMPTAWTVVSFAHDKGYGTLRDDSGEEVVFDASAWDIGDHPAARKMAAAALMPQVGEPVAVEWRRSVTGKNVPRVVRPTSRVWVDRPQLTLAAWLKLLQRHGQLFVGLTAAKLCKALASLDADLADEWADGEPREAADFAHLLMALAHLAQADAAWGVAHGQWLYADDHRWDRQRASHQLPAMLGLASPVPTAGDGYQAGGEQSLSDYARLCNEAARAAGCAPRLHELDLDGDEHVLVCLPPEAFVALAKRGCWASAE